MKFNVSNPVHRWMLKHAFGQGSNVCSVFAGASFKGAQYLIVALSIIAAVVITITAAIAIGIFFVIDGWIAFQPVSEWRVAYAALYDSTFLSTDWWFGKAVAYTGIVIISFCYGTAGAIVALLVVWGGIKSGSWIASWCCFGFNGLIALLRQIPLPCQAVELIVPAPYDQLRVGDPITLRYIWIHNPADGLLHTGTITDLTPDYKGMHIDLKGNDGYHYQDYIVWDDCTPGVPGAWFLDSVTPSTSE